MAALQEAQEVLDFSNARLWLVQYAPQFYSLEMTDDETREALMSVWDTIRPALQKCIDWLNENLPNWQELSSRGGAVA